VTFVRPAGGPSLFGPDLWLVVVVTSPIPVAVATKKLELAFITNTMKFTSTFAALMILSEAQAFAPSQPAFSRTARTQLFENLLEGRKIGGEVVPVNNFLLVKLVGKKESTDQGILLTGANKVVKTQGAVVSVGPGKTHEESGRVFAIDLKEGDGVVYGEYDGTEIDLNGSPHMLIRDNNVLVKYTGEKLALDGVDVLNDCVLVHIDDDEQSSAGGVILNTSSKNQSRPSTGTVVKVGPGKMAGDGELLPMNVALGERVKFMDFAGNELEIEGEEYSVVRMAEILAKF
jgi:chaperonin GroES